MQDFRQLDVWRKSHDLTLQVYMVTRTFPEGERFGLTSQLRRCCSSIPANLAEGCGRATDKDFARFVQTALGSFLEADYHLLLSHDLGYIDAPMHHALGQETQSISRMLNALYQRLTKRRKPQA
jgi:four helix bundle protein